MGQCGYQIYPSITYKIFLTLYKLAFNWNRIKNETVNFYVELVWFYTVYICLNFNVAERFMNLKELKQLHVPTICLQNEGHFCWNGPGIKLIILTKRLLKIVIIKVQFYCWQTPPLNAIRLKSSIFSSIQVCVYVIRVDECEVY